MAADFGRCQPVTGGRGLKRFVTVLFDDAVKSLPAWGARIETFVVGRGCCGCYIAPRMGGAD